MSAQDFEQAILVFCTGVRDDADMQMLGEVMTGFPDILSWTLDLDDWEKVLRVVCYKTQPEDIVIALSNYGIFAREMMD